MIDTHCHLDSQVLRENLQNVLAEAQEVGVETFVIPGADLEDLPKAWEIAKSYENVYFASGVHPYHLDTFDLNVIREAQKDSKCIAIGECGLDYFRLPQKNVEAYKQQQRECFRTQIELSLELDKPLILHAREASGDMLSILKEYPRARGVLHCFCADECLLELKDRFFYGIGGVLTFSNARRLVEILPKIPKERLVLETDSPYLTPHPFRGQCNAPKYMPLVLKKMAEILQVPLVELEEICNQNTKELFPSLK